MLAACVMVAGFLLLVGLAVYFAVPRRRWRSGGKRVHPRVLLRALLPPRMMRSRSGRADIAFFLFSMLLAGSTMGWALWSSRSIENALYAEMVRHIGSPDPTTLPLWVCGTITTLVLYFAYELAYWFNHWLSHRLAPLWHFHKVHHTAESLSMLTNFRVHPVDTIVFYNMVAIATGVAAALLDLGFGRKMDPVTTGGANLLVFLTQTVLINLQHSHLWISLPGRWGKWVLSPAHHQIHHSVERRHHNRNFGATLGLFDRLFGTLHVPAARRERLSFGVGGLDHDPHSLHGTTIQPFIAAGRSLWRSVKRGRAGIPVSRPFAEA